jgi:hypothetical protein
MLFHRFRDSSVKAAGSGCDSSNRLALLQDFDMNAAIDLPDDGLGYFGRRQFVYIDLERVSRTLNRAQDERKIALRGGPHLYGKCECRKRDQACDREYGNLQLQS